MTVENLASHIKNKGITIRYNEINHNQNITGLDNQYGNEHSQDILPVLLYDELRFIYDKCTKGDIRDFLHVISIQNKYNPVLDMINGLKWDGKDRLPQLYKILNIQETDQLSRTLIYCRTAQ